VTYVNATAVQNSSTTTGTTISIPSGAAAGNVLLVGVLATGTSHTDMTVTIGANSLTRLTPASGVSNLASSGRYTTWQRVLTSGDLSTGTVTIASVGSTTGRWTAVALVDTSTDTSPVFAVADYSSGAGNIPFPAATPSGSSGTVVYIGFANGASGTQLTSTAADGATVRAQESNTAGSGSNGHSVVATKTYSSSAEVAASTAITLSASSGARTGITVLLAGASLTPPTVSAGADQTVEAGAADFTLTGTATGNGGATIVSRSWERISGPTVALSGTTTATVTITPPATTGTLVMRHSATDSNGQTSTDDVNVTFVQPGQSLRPNGDVSNTGAWTATPSATPISSNIDETVASSADYIASPSLPSAAAYTASLAPGIDPGVNTGHVVEVQVWRDSGITSHTLAVALMQGSTVIKTQDFTDLTTTPTTRQFTLSEAEAGNITDYTALRIRFTATAAV
jgi:hypothetical protein